MYSAKSTNADIRPVKRIPLLLTALLCISGGLVSSRGQEPSALHPASIEAAIPAYLYCEIIGSHLPSYRGDGVLFDFGQKTEAWAYNWLTDAEGHKLVFGSVVEALNYMVSRGWEFVQAYVSGNEHQTTHFLLRRASSCLSDTENGCCLLNPARIRRRPKREKRETTGKRAGSRLFFYFLLSRMRIGKLFAFPE